MLYKLNNLINIRFMNYLFGTLVAVAILAIILFFDKETKTERKQRFWKRLGVIGTILVIISVLAELLNHISPLFWLNNLVGGFCSLCVLFLSTFRSREDVIVEE